MGLTTRLAQFVEATTLDQMSDEARSKSRQMMLNAAGVGIAGSVTREGRVIAEYAREAGGNGASTLLGSGERVSAMSAALANGTMVHALDFDEAILRRSNHPSNVIFPTVMALGEQQSSSGAAVLEAFTIGCEVSTKIGAAGDLDELIPSLARNGWHVEGVGGAIGAAAAAAKLLGLDETQTAHALGIAVSQASGTQVNYGTSTKSLHCGQAAMHGVIAGSLARKGFTAALNAIENINGFFGCFRRDIDVDEDEFISRLGNPYDTVSPGLALKLYPCASATHSAIDAIRYLVATHDIAPDDVRLVHVSCPARAGNDLKSFTHPRTGLEGKFSLNYCVAVALVHGIPRMHHFTEAAISEPQLVALLDRVELERTEVATLEVSRPSTVTITLRDGRVVSHRVEHAKGHPAFPLTVEELDEKFRYCVDGILTAAVADHVIEQLRAIERVPDVTELFGCLGAGQ